jgi:hypothetical protein
VKLQKALYESERIEKDRLFLLLQYMTNNGLVRYSPATPSRANKYNSSLGGNPLGEIQTPFESAFFEAMGKDIKQDREEESCVVKGNTFRLQKLPGGRRVER